jgi:DNA polymerase (family X)
LPGFGEKTQKNYLEAIGFLKKGSGRILLDKASALVEKVTKYLNQCPQIEKLEIAGSYRRKKETIGDLDFLAVSEDPEAVMNYFIRFPGVVKVLGQGTTKASIKVEGGVNIDLRVVPKESFGAALQYFTGSKEHNIMLRQIALDKGYKLNEYGLFKGKKRIAGKKEIEIYEALGLCFIKPKLRVNEGEIERAKKCFKNRKKNRD